MGDKQYVVVATFSDAPMAQLAKLHLEGEGIQCFLENENTGMTLWHLQLAIGGIKLRVRAEDEQAACSLLDAKIKSNEPEESESDEFDDNSHADTEQPDAEVKEDPKPTGPSCPSCHGYSIQRFTWTRRIRQASTVIAAGIIASLLAGQPIIISFGAAVGVYLLLVKPDHRCMACSKSWIEADV